MIIIIINDFPSDIKKIIKIHKIHTLRKGIFRGRNFRRRYFSGIYFDNFDPIGENRWTWINLKNKFRENLQKKLIPTKKKKKMYELLCLQWILVIIIFKRKISNKICKKSLHAYKNSKKLKNVYKHKVK